MILCASYLNLFSFVKKTRFNDNKMILFQEGYHRFKLLFFQRSEKRNNATKKKRSGGSFSLTHIAQMCKIVAHPNTLHKPNRTHFFYIQSKLDSHAIVNSHCKMMRMVRNLLFSLYSKSVIRAACTCILHNSRSRCHQASFPGHPRVQKKPFEGVKKTSKDAVISRTEKSIPFKKSRKTMSDAF